MRGKRALPALALMLLLLALCASGSTSAPPPFATVVSPMPWSVDQPVLKVPPSRFKYLGRTWDHPTWVATQGLHLLASYAMTGDRAYLSLAIRDAEHLLARSTTEDGAVWFGFTFPWNHGDDTALQAPWYSALTQGDALALFSRLATTTHDPRWRSAADATFASFLAPRRAGHPWVTDTDEDGHLWLEEYPSDGPIDRILNGHMTAAFAIWEYWRATGSLKAHDLLSAAAEAVKHYGPLFRVPGEVSFYGLRFKAQHGRYHLAHIAELHTLAQITGDSFFDRLADAFASDTPWLLGH
jgi:hypothetical protein